MSRHALNVHSFTLIHQSSFGNTRPQFIVALPVLHIHRIKGVYTEWLDFYAMFATVIGSDVDLTQIEKFQHLRSRLGGAALDTIHSLEISNDNYVKASDLL